MNMSVYGECSIEVSSGNETNNVDSSSRGMVDDVNVSSGVKRAT